LITFAPGAFVWHHRRQNPRSYLRQQAGYGEAEALLHTKHPDRFNGRGDGKWGGVMYGGSLKGIQLAVPIIYRGMFGTGMFQCLYQPPAASRPDDAPVPDCSSRPSAMPSRSSGPGHGIGPGYHRNAHPGSIRRH
jgi:hypothetical protein